ncbi:MAG: hypothetical protein ACRBEQ_07895 [Hyphomonas sp.]
MNLSARGAEEKGFDLLTSDDRFRDVLDVLPVVYVGTLQSDPTLSFALLVSPVDGWFIDESVPAQIGLVPEVSLAIFDTSKNALLDDAARCQSVASLLRCSLGSVTGKWLAMNRGTALENAAGEATQIARTWFGEGVARLLEEKGTDNRLTGEETFNFWSRFVEELLCLEIEGVSKTETFPFDRAFIIAETGASPDSVTPDSPRLRVRVLEAALESVSPKDRFQFMTSLERQGRNIFTDFDVTSKRVNFTREFSICREGNGRIMMSRPVKPEEYSDSAAMEPLTDDLKKHGMLNVENPPAVWGNACDMSLEAMMSVPVGEEASLSFNTLNTGALKRANSEQLRSSFSDEGFLYEFTQRTNLHSDSPLITAISCKYLEALALELKEEMNHQPDGVNLEIDAWKHFRKDDQRETESKIVTICFEPRLSQLNQRGNVSGRHGSSDQRQDASEIAQFERKKLSADSKSEAQDFYLMPSEHRVTIILIADEDEEKSVPDLDSEREDLKLLTDMIFRQRLRDKRREVEHIEKRVNIVYALMNGLMHRFSGEIEDPSRRKELRAQWEGLLKTVSFDTSSIQKLDAHARSESYLADIWFSTFEELPAPSDSDALRATLVQSLEARVVECAKGSGRTPPKLTCVFVPCPEMQMALPLTAVKECIDVTLKNAVEAALGKFAPDEAEITIVLSTSYAPEERRWMFDILVQNTTAPLGENVWRSLTAERPVPLGTNSDKTNSTGVGVYAARELLRNALGERCDIRYSRMGDNRVQARIQLPAEPDAADFSSVGQEIQTSTEQLGGVVPDILLLEDDPNYHQRTLRCLEEYAPDLKVAHVTNLDDFLRCLGNGLPQLLMSDLSILESADGSMAERGFGIMALREFGKVCQSRSEYPPVWIMSGESPEEIRESLEGDEENCTLLGGNYSIRHQAHDSSDVASDALIILDHKVLSIENDDAIATVQIAVNHIRARGVEVSQSKTSTNNVSVSDSHKAIIKWVGPDNFIDRYARIVEGIEDKPDILLVQADTLPVVEALGFWFSHKSVVSTRRKEVDKIWKNTFHKVPFLLLSEQEGAKLSPNLRYHLLSRKAVVKIGSPKKTGALIAQLKSESRGPISVIRHDAVNIAEATKDTIRQQVNTLENLLAVPETVLTELDPITFEKRKGAVNLTELNVACVESYDAARTLEAYRRVRNTLESMRNTTKVSLIIASLDSTMKLVGVE